MSNERGSASVELVMLTIPLMVLVVFAIFVGRFTTAKQDVTSAARDAGRAASLRQFPEAAEADGEAAARATLINEGIECQTLEIEIDAGQLIPGETITAKVICSLLLSDISGFGMPGTVVAEAESLTVVDRHRGGEVSGPTTE